MQIERPTLYFGMKKWVRHHNEVRAGRELQARFAQTYFRLRIVFIAFWTVKSIELNHSNAERDAFAGTL